MKRVAASLALLFFSVALPAFASTEGRPAEKVAPVVMSKLVVSGRRLPSGWFTVAWECKGPLPLDALKKVWIDNLLPGSPADSAGVQIGDRVLSIDGTSVEKLNGLSLRTLLEREHDPGTQLEFCLQTPGEAKHLFVVKFEGRTAH
jgi:S1-C subfamily serine protease